MSKDQKPLPVQWNLLAGAIAGVSEILLMYPLDVIKTRQQLQVGSSTGMISAFKNLIKNEGVGAMVLFINLVSWYTASYSC